MAEMVYKWKTKRKTMWINPSCDYRLGDIGWARLGYKLCGNWSRCLGVQDI